MRPKIGSNKRSNKVGKTNVLKSKENFRESLMVVESIKENYENDCQKNLISSFFKITNKLMNLLKTEEVRYNKDFLNVIKVCFWMRKL